eukprot:12116621-Alexandrium_andersonii.AAC.1
MEAASLSAHSVTVANAPPPSQMQHARQSGTMSFRRVLHGASRHACMGTCWHFVYRHRGLRAKGPDL